MPKSKKPRHKYKPKAGIDFTKVRRQDIEFLQDEFTKIELATEMRLPFGKTTDNDFYMMRDFINWGIVASTVREWLPEKTRLDANDLLHKAAKATTEVQIRGRKNHGIFVCKAEELNLIQDAIEVVGDLMRESLKECPTLVVREWNAMRKHSANATMGKPVMIDVAQLIREVNPH